MTSAEIFPRKTLRSKSDRIKPNDVAASFCQKRKDPAGLSTKFINNDIGMLFSKFSNWIYNNVLQLIK